MRSVFEDVAFGIGVLLLIVVVIGALLAGAGAEIDIDWGSSGTVIGIVGGFILLAMWLWLMRFTLYWVGRWFARGFHSIDRETRESV